MNSNNAKAGILEIHKENLKIKPVNVAYDVNGIIEEINKFKFPIYKEILQIFYGHNTHERIVYSKLIYI